MQEMCRSYIHSLNDNLQLAVSLWMKFLRLSYFPGEWCNQLSNSVTAHWEHDNLFCEGKKRK